MRGYLTCYIHGQTLCNNQEGLQPPPSGHKCLMVLCRGPFNAMFYLRIPQMSDQVVDDGPHGLGSANSLAHWQAKSKSLGAIQDQSKRLECAGISDISRSQDDGGESLLSCVSWPSSCHRPPASLDGAIKRLNVHLLAGREEFLY